MPRRCTICLHPERAAIDRALIALEPSRAIADRFSISRSSVMRHQVNHLPARLAQGHAAQTAAAQAGLAARRADVAEAVALAREQQTREAENIGQAIDVVKQLRAVNAACLEVLKKARASGDDATLLRAVDRLHRQIELQARLLGELQDAPQVNFVVLPEWQRIRVLVVDALQPYPEARRRVVQVLSDAGA